MTSFLLRLCNRWRPIMLPALLAIVGCDAKPELRPIDQVTTSMSVVAGRQLLEQGRAAEAVTAFRRQLRLQGADLQSLNGLAIAYSELGRPDLAAESFARALAIAPDDPATLNNIGFAALRRADSRLARHYLEKASGRKAGDAHDEIQGNLTGLALLEAIEGRPTSRRSPIRAAWSAADDGAAAPRRPTIRTRSDPAASAAVFAGATPFDLSTVTVVDFTAVIDPFSQRTSAE